MKSIKQGLNSDDCVACVAAMATGTSVEKFKGLMEHEGPYTDFEFYCYLLGHGFIVGIGFDSSGRKDFDPMEELMATEVELVGRPAYIVVTSETREEPGARHVIYWDGEKIFDPNPLAEDGRPMGSYVIWMVFPIGRVEGVSAT